MQQTLPPQLTPIPRPKGFYTQFKQWPITPLSSNMYWQPDDIVRFLVNINQGVMDPYRSHIQITVQVNSQILPVGGVQIDNSAQSFFSQSVVSSKQVQIQRITEYDTLAAILTDLGFSQIVCESRDVQGLGYSNQQSHKPLTHAMSRNGGTQFIDIIDQDMQVHWPIYQTCNTGLISPTASPIFGSTGGDAILDSTGDRMEALQYWTAWGSGNDNFSSKNPYWNTHLSGIPTPILNSGRLCNLRAQYVDRIGAPNYPDGPTTTLGSGGIYVKNQTWNKDNMDDVGYNPKNPYQIGFSRSKQSSLAIGGQFKTYNHVNTPNIFGYERPISADFCRGTKQTLLSPTIPQIQMQNGKLLNEKIPLTQKTFRLPLISAICGVLIPPDQFNLIPMAALQDLLVELTLNRFAMFSTGYSDVHERDEKGMLNPIPRRWLITGIQWNLHLYTFPDEKAQNIIKQSLTKSIIITATGYSLCGQFQLPNGNVVHNSWPIGCQYSDLCEIMCVFLSNDYQSRPFCRKQFRLSNNITSMQIKLDTNYYPSQPIVGNAGNPQQIDNTGDNWPFYEMILLSSNRLFSTNHPYPRINPRNFAVNERFYDVTNTRTYWDPQMKKNNNYVWTQKSINGDTALGLANFHQNRCVGRSVFFFTWQPYGTTNQFMTGVDTSGVRNFQITFNNAPYNVFPRDQTLLIFARYNQIVQYSNQGVRTYGK